MRTLKWLVGLLLLPVTYAAIRTLWDLVLSARPDTLAEVPVGVWSLAGGFTLWVFIFLAMSRPVRTYILAHELTHALWGALMGARVSKLKVSGKGGSVHLSKTNFLITLAPYFYPFYTVLAIAAYYLLLIFFDIRRYEPFWLSVIGLTWGFHLTFTIVMLMERQSDIHDNGRLFSYTIIVLFNVLFLCLGIVVVAAPTLADFDALLGGHLNQMWNTAASLVPSTAAD